MSQIKKYCSHFSRLLKILVLTATLFLLAACQVEIYNGLTEEQSNTMLASLLKRGVHAQKTSAGKEGYALSVPEDQVVLALEILREKGLPRDEYKSLGAVFSGQGMISSPTEEQARLAYAISQELADTFSRIDGVLTARVHIVFGKNDPLTETVIQPSAAVFLRHTPESIVTTMVSNIREITAKAVPSLNYDRVSVMLVPVREDISVPVVPPTSSVLGLSVPENQFGKSILFLIISFVIGAGAAIVAFKLIVRRKKKLDLKEQKALEE